MLKLSAKERENIKSLTPLKLALSRFDWDIVSPHLTASGGLNHAAIYKLKNTPEFDDVSYESIPDRITIQVSSCVYDIYNTKKALLTFVYRLGIKADSVFPASCFDASQASKVIPIWDNCQGIQTLIKRDKIKVFLIDAKPDYFPLYATEPYSLTTRRTLWFALIGGKLLFLTKDCVASAVSTGILFQKDSPFLSKRVVEAGLLTEQFQTSMQHLRLQIV